MMKPIFSLATFFTCALQATGAEYLYVSYSDEIVRKYTLSGALLDEFSFHPFSPEFGIIHISFAVDRKGFVFSTYSLRGEIKRHSPDGEDLGVFGSVPSSALGLTFHDSGLLYVGVNSTPDTVERFAADGTSLGIFATSFNNGPGAPFELVFDEFGNLYQPANLGVEWFDSSGNTLGFFATLDGVTDSFINDLAFDSLGNLYVKTLDDEIYSFDQSGELLGHVLSLPVGSEFTIGSNDILYVANGGSVQTYQTDGTPLGVLIDRTFLGAVRDLEIVNIVPEPTTVFFALTGLACMFLAIRRSLDQEI